MVCNSLLQIAIELVVGLCHLEQTIANQRTSVSGVDEDEEALNLVKFQYSYNMASKIISVMNQMLDKLINDTGVA